ncbi:MAG TPA: nuclear transport factor 2 family protein, partial [Mycobacterium sp.]|nr:nuclear transport factor 2 family protein [Mycobacterium sp.]
DGLWSRQEDIYNPLRFVQAGVKWCKKARELGTLDDEAAAWLDQLGART